MKKGEGFGKMLLAESGVRHGKPQIGFYYKTKKQYYYSVILLLLSDFEIKTFICTEADLQIKSFLELVCFGMHTVFTKPRLQRHGNGNCQRI